MHYVYACIYEIKTNKHKNANKLIQQARFVHT